MVTTWERVGVEVGCDPRVVRGELGNCVRAWDLRGRGAGGGGGRAKREEAAGGRREKPAGRLAPGDRWKVAHASGAVGWEAARV